ncbi:hypothetical protein NDS46_30300 (plasmid) [Paenibacillus thiaminolyticus]|uniref:hypothetical protein n=1 Tax=Paenibacillus thiaminolyticus TaxID=49283 RepID=UPI00232EFC68|nr:hypothetical protein [Paenibacillus thiaminolyticus]WCF11640.1 hypothetical protein NDS46_30300 [Paenibacillus thiaminolyticus]
MGEFATLTVLRKVSRRIDPIYNSIYEGKKRGESVEQILKKEKRHDLNVEKFRDIHFFEQLTGIYYAFASYGQKHDLSLELRMERDIPSEWLLCFSYHEMEVLGLDMGVFQAESSVHEVMERLEWSEIQPQNELFVKRHLLIRWLKENAHIDDRLKVCSNWIFHHEEAKYDYYYVQNFINSKIAKMQKEILCPHWTKNKVERPRQLNMQDMIEQMTETA